jgi:hypothetical protein
MPQPGRKQANQRPGVEQSRASSHSPKPSMYLGLSVRSLGSPFTVPARSRARSQQEISAVAGCLRSAFSRLSRTTWDFHHAPCLGLACELVQQVFGQLQRNRPHTDSVIRAVLLGNTGKRPHEIAQTDQGFQVTESPAREKPYALLCMGAGLVRPPARRYYSPCATLPRQKHNRAFMLLAGRVPVMITREKSRCWYNFR